MIAWGPGVLYALDAVSGDVVAKSSLSQHVGWTQPETHGVGEHVFLSSRARWAEASGREAPGMYLRRVGADGDTGWQLLRRGDLSVERPTLFSPDGRLAVGLVRLGACPPGRGGSQRWDVATGAPVGEIIEGGWPVGVSADGAVLLQTTDRLQVWRDGKAQPTAELPIVAKQAGFYPDGRVWALDYRDRHGYRLLQLDVTTGVVTEHRGESATGTINAVYVPQLDLVIKHEGTPTVKFERPGGTEVAGLSQAGIHFSPPLRHPMPGRAWFRAGGGVASLTDPTIELPTPIDGDPTRFAWLRSLSLPLPPPPLLPEPASRACGEIRRDGSVDLTLLERAPMDATAKPLRHATIELRPHFGDMPVEGGHAIGPVRSRSDGQGGLQLRDLPRIQWSVHVLGRGGRELPYDRPPTVSLKGKTQRIERTLTLKPHPAYLDHVPLRRAQLLRPDGTPAAGATVTQFDAAGNPGASVTTDRRGRFELPRGSFPYTRAALPDGHITHISRAEWADHTRRTFTLYAPDNPRVQHFRVTNDTGERLPADVLRARFHVAVDAETRVVWPCTDCCEGGLPEPFGAWTTRHAQSDGHVCQVVLHTGSLSLELGALEDPWVRLDMIDAPPTRYGAEPQLTPDEDGSGKLHFRQLPAGRYRLRVKHEGAEHAADLTLEAGQHRSMRLPKPEPTPLWGRVVDERTGLPMTGISIWVQGARPEYVETGLDGSFSFDSVLPGDARLRIRGHHGRPEFVSRVRVARDGPTDAGMLQFPFDPDAGDSTP